MCIAAVYIAAAPAPATERKDPKRDGRMMIVMASRVPCIHTQREQCRAESTSILDSSLSLCLQGRKERER